MTLEKISFEEYQAREGLNISTLKMFRRSPAHFLQAKNEPVTENPALRFGSLVHCLILEPEIAQKSFIALPKVDRRTKEGKAKFDAFTAEFEGACFVTEEEMEAAKQIAANLDRKIYSFLLHGENSQNEVSMFWEHDGVQCKGRLDHLSDWAVVDLKTTKDASPDAFAKSVYTYGYHNQAAWYIDGCKANGIEIENFVIIAIEKEPPYASAAYRLTDDVIALARLENEKWLEQFRICNSQKSFPDYANEIQDIGIPAWATRRTDLFLNGGEDDE